MDEANARKHIRGYLLVGTVLLIFTGLTVSASYLDLPLVPTIFLALFIASIKASLVACYFMHLLSEKKLVYIILVITILFFIPLMMLPVITGLDRYGGGF